MFDVPFLPPGLLSRWRASLRSRPRVVLGLLFLWAFAIQIAFLALMGGGKIGPDSEEFLLLARNLAEEHSFQTSPEDGPFFDRVPLYPLIAACALRLPLPWPDATAVACCQAAFAAAAAVVFGLTAGYVVHRRWVWLCVTMFALYRGTIWTVNLLTRESVAACWVGLGMYLALRASIQQSARRGGLFAAAAGLAYGLGCLTREETAAFAVVAAVFLATAAGGSWWRNLKRLSAPLLAGVLIVLLPWAGRNLLLAKRLLLLSTAGGTELYAGNNPRVAEEGVDYGFAPTLRRESHMDPFETNAHYKAMALSFMRDRPVRSLANAAAKVWSWLQPYDETGLGCYGWFAPVLIGAWLLARSGGSTRPGRWLAAAAVAWAVVVFVAIGDWEFRLNRITGSYRGLWVLGWLGVAVSIRRLRHHGLLLGTYVCAAAVAGLIIPQVRQRYVVDGVLVVYACAFFEALRGLPAMGRGTGRGNAGGAGSGVSPQAQPALGGGLTCPPPDARQGGGEGRRPPSDAASR